MTRIDRALADHRASVVELTQCVAAIPPNRWLVPRAEGKWSPAEEALHVRQVYDVLLAAENGGAGLRSRVPEWQATVLRHTVLPLCIAIGRLPRGVRAPRELKPDLSASEAVGPEDAAIAIGVRAREFEDVVVAAAARGVAVTLRHPYFGMIGGGQGLRFLALHNRHHLRHLIRAGRASVNGG